MDFLYSNTLFGPVPFPSPTTPDSTLGTRTPGTSVELHSPISPTARMSPLDLCMFIDPAPVGPFMMALHSDLPEFASQPTVGFHLASQEPVIRLGPPLLLRPVTWAEPVPRRPRDATPPPTATGYSKIIPRCPPMQVKIPPQTGRKQYKCLERGCGSMVFQKLNALKLHMLTHTREQPHQCEWCERRFSLRCNLVRHYKTCKKRKAEQAARPSKPGTRPSLPKLTISSNSNDTPSKPITTQSTDDDTPHSYTPPALI